MKLNATPLEYPESMLGMLTPHCLPEDAHKEPQIINGAAIINGVALPQHVIDELWQLGISLSWYNAGELAQAIEACAYDHQLIDDEAGIHFADKLSLTDSERKQRSQKEKIFSFRDRYLKERERKKSHAIACEEDESCVDLA